MIIPDIIEQHWEEAGLLWGRRCAVVRKASLSLTSLAELDERIEAHLDGLRAAGNEGWELCANIATWEDPGEAFVAGAMSLAEPHEANFNEVLKRATANPALGRGLISALGWMDPSAVQARIRQLLTSESPIIRRIGLGAAAVHRLNLDGPLRESLNDEDEEVRARACRAAGELGRKDLASRVQAAGGPGSETSSFWSAWAVGLLTGEPQALERLRDLIVPPSPWQMRALQVWLRRQPIPAAISAWREIVRQPELTRLAIAAAGIIGDPGSIPWLLEQMENPAHLRVAADAFQTITGADFVRDRLRMNSPPRPPVPEDRGRDEPEQADDDLVWPEPKAIRQWWSQCGGQFEAGTRFLLGKPISVEWLREVLPQAQQHQRAGAALELAIRQPGQPLFNVAAPGFRQKLLLRKTEVR
jgi:uncharacterized protein (TIGR02270 family)